MKIEDIPTYVVLMHVDRDCEIDGCADGSAWIFRNTMITDPDAFQTWALCRKHGLELLDLQEKANETT